MDKPLNLKAINAELAAVIPGGFRPRYSAIFANLLYARIAAF